MSTRIGKIAGYGLLGLIGLAAVAAGYIYFFKLGYIELPKYRMLSSPQVSEKIDIYRDDHGVPHIYASNNSDAFFAAGYTMAEDRLFQIEMAVRAGKGQLSEILGPGLIEYDKYEIIKGYTKAELTAQIEAMPEESKRSFLAMVAGVNAYVDEANANPDEKMPLEFTDLVMGIKLKPYEPEDIFAGAVMLLRKFGASGGTELSNKAFLDDMTKKYGPEKAKIIFDDILPFSDPDAYAVDKDAPQAVLPAPSPENYAALSESAIDDLQASRRARTNAQQTLASIGISMGASRSTLIGPERSVTGNPIMMQATADGGDIHIVTPDINFAGLYVPPFAFPVMGRTPTVGMFITTGERDTRDTFYVKTDPKNKHRYFYQGEWLDMEKRTEVIKVKGAEDVPYDVYRTVHGPVMLWDEDANLAYTQRWAMWGQEAQIIAGTYDTLKLNTADEYEAALQTMTATNNNTSYADAGGSIGFRHMGSIPVRAEGTDPRLPANGDGSENWRGFVSNEDTPAQRDPEKGYLFIWNNKPSSNTVHADAARYGKHFRTHLPVELIEAKEKLSIEDLKVFNEVIGSSFYSVDLKFTSPRFFDAYMKEAITKSDNPKVKAAAEAIMAWDGLFTDADDDGLYDQPGLPLFLKWRKTALETIFNDDIGTWWNDLDDDLYIPYQTSLLIRVLEGADTGLPLKWDYLNGRDRSELVIESLQSTVEALENEFAGKDIADWRQPQYWSFINWTDIGDSDLPRLKHSRSTGYTGAATFLGYLPKVVKDNGMPNWNAIMEITDENPHYLSSIPSGGQSWFINKDWKANPHINDQYNKHVNFEYKTVYMDRDKVQSDYKQKLTIEPAK